MMQSMSAKGSKNYPRAKQHGRNALILTIIDIMFTLLIAVLATGLTIGFECAYIPSYYYTYGYSIYSKFLNYTDSTLMYVKSSPASIHIVFLYDTDP